MSVLAARLADEQEVLGFVEQRVAKAGMFSLLSSALPDVDNDAEAGGAAAAPTSDGDGAEPGAGHAS